MKTVWLALGLAPLAACASYPAPTQRLVQSESSVRAADEVGASSDPQAALQLRLAQEEVAAAKERMQHGDNERADYLLVRAKADADLALMLARATKAKAEAAQAQQQATELKQSLQGQGQGQGQAPQ